MGYSCATTVLSAAASHDLTDLATVRDELSIKTADTSNDSWLSRAITQVSAAIERHTKRTFAPELLQDAFDIDQDAYPYQTPGGFAALQLTRWPVIDVVSVVQATSATSTQALTEGKDFRVDYDTGALLRLNAFTGVVTAWEAIPVTVVYLAGFGAEVLEGHAVPASPFQITVAKAASYSCTQSVTYPNGTALAAVASSPAQGQYSVTAGGVYTFAAGDQGVNMAFIYATRKIPDDLVALCLQLITARFKAKGRDPALIQRDTPELGTERFWFGGAPGQTGQFPPDIQAALDDFRVPTVA